VADPLIRALADHVLIEAALRRLDSHGFYRQRPDVAPPADIARLLVRRDELDRQIHDLSRAEGA
jgi:hypothetical protein